MELIHLSHCTYMTGLELKKYILVTTLLLILGKALMGISWLQYTHN